MAEAAQKPLGNIDENLCLYAFPSCVFVHANVRARARAYVRVRTCAARVRVSVRVFVRK